MIKELSELGKSLRSQKNDREWVHNALKEELISIEIVITEDGSFQKIELFEKKLTIAEAITAKKGKARLLLDKAEEVLCYGYSGPQNPDNSIRWLPVTERIR